MGNFEHDFETSGSIEEHREYFDELRDCQFLKEGTYSVAIVIIIILCPQTTLSHETYVEMKLDLNHCPSQDSSVLH
jgi:hypothetical protein